ncbi:MAG: chromate efflux transporter [Anaerolineae bacterium]|nr:chromate efflux transporter [Anaerolineae bacterium]
MANSQIPYRDALRVWLRVAALSFGGPTAQIAVMHKLIVEEKQWVDEARFLHALNYCMLLPGPEAQQLATYLGWLLHKTRGGLTAGILFVLPGAVSVWLLSVLYAGFQHVTFVQGLFFGLKAAVIALVVEAVLRIARRVLKNEVMIGIAVLSFVAIFFFNAPFPALIATAGLIGFVGGKLGWRKFDPVASSTAKAAPDQVSRSPHWVHTLRIFAVGVLLWVAPVLLIVAFTGNPVLGEIGWFFGKAAVLTFGGAYSILAYVAQQVVEVFGWLRPSEMLDGLGMAETTPGPLIMVVQFVGFMAAYRQPGALPPMLAATLGAAVTTWVTFVPSFMWVFMGAPYVEQLRGIKALSTALSAITAAVVGVVLNLAVWFALHTWFGVVNEVTWGAVHLTSPVWASLNGTALLISAVAFILLFGLRRGMLLTLAVCAALGVGLGMTG